MRCREGAIAKERLVGIPARTNEVDGGLGEDFRGETIGEVPGLRRILARGIVVMDWCEPVIIHSSKKNAGARLEGTMEGRNAIVPFAGAKGVIPRLGELFPEQWSSQRALRVGAAVEQGILQLEIGCSGVKHGPAWDADGAVTRPEMLRLRKARSPRGQSVERRGEQLFDAAAAEGCSPLVVSDRENDVGRPAFHQNPERRLGFALGEEPIVEFLILQGGGPCPGPDIMEFGIDRLASDFSERLDHLAGTRDGNGLVVCSIPCPDAARSGCESQAPARTRPGAARVLSFSQTPVR